MARSTSSAKRSDLLATASRLFYRNGYQRIGIDTLLAEAGVAKKTLYHHFTSKDELVVAMLEEKAAASLGELDTRVNAAGAQPVSRFLAVFDWLMDWVESRDFNGCAFTRAFSEFPDEKHPVHRAAWRFKAETYRRLLSLAEECKVKRPDRLAEAAQLLIEGAIVVAHGSGRRDSAVAAKSTIQTLLAAAMRVRVPTNAARRT
jgi:AcrR family transcriptional regulator